MEPGYRLVEIKDGEEWKLKIGDYELAHLLGDTAVVTIRSEIDLSRSERVAIYGKMMTENLGVSYVVANVLANSRIRYLFVCGLETKGHCSGDSLVSLYRNGVIVDGERIKVKGTRAADPTIPLEADEIEEVIDRLRRQVELIEMIGETDPEVILREIEKRPKKEPIPEGPFYVTFKKLGSVDVPGGEVVIDPFLSITDELWVREVK